MEKQKPTSYFHLGENEGKKIDNGSHSEGWEKGTPPSKLEAAAPKVKIEKTALGTITKKVDDEDDDELLDAVSDVLDSDSSVSRKVVKTRSHSCDDTFDISFIELSIINNYLFALSEKELTDELFDIRYHGTVNRLSRVKFSDGFSDIEEYFFTGYLKNDENREIPLIIQTNTYVDHNGYVQNKCTITKKDDTYVPYMPELIKHLKRQSFFNSKYSGKCIKVSLIQGQFKGIEIIDVEEQSNELVLTKTQRRFLEHFVKRLKRGKSIRALLNGVPGTGKTETIREVARRLVPDATFIIPEFKTTSDLTSILEACEIFKSGVIIMDDIDLFLGSRENGSYTQLLGEFLSFFDGVKKRTISVLASTNDKGLVDKAAERPGRFNLTLDYGYLDKDQIIRVCQIHLPEEFNVDRVYNALTENIGGQKPKITGAFISNLAENLIEMAEDDENWSIEDTETLIHESYKGFYSSQVNLKTDSIGFVKN